MINNLLPYKKVVVKLEYVTTGYKERKNVKIVSKDITVQIRNGELVALIGANGCGKSTLMRCIGGLQKVIDGSIFIDDKNVVEMSSSERAKYLSFVLTDQIESANLTVYDIVSNGRYPHIGYLGKLSTTDWKIVNDSLEACSLSGWGNRMFSSLSDGEKQRVLIARALSQDTPLMLLDEPTAHLDLPNRVEMMRMLNDLAKKTGKAILLSTHELDLAMQWSDTIWLMDSQKNLVRGIPEDIALSGMIGRTFNSRNILFDMESGSFKSTKGRTRPIKIKGSGIKRLWTERALERIGMENVDVGENLAELHVFDDMWLLSIDGLEHSYSRLEDVLKLLQDKEYWISVLN